LELPWSESVTGEARACQDADMATDANVQLKTRARALAASSGLTFDEALVLLRAQVGADLEAEVRAAPVRPRIGVNARSGMRVAK